MPGNAEVKPKSVFQLLKEHKEEVAVVGGFAFLATASVLARKRLFQANALARYNAWQSQRGGSHLVAMSVNKQPVYMCSDAFNWSRMGLRRSCVADVARSATQTLGPQLRQLDLSLPYIGHGPNQDNGVSADAAFGHGHVTISMDYLDGEHNGLLNFNLARQAYRIDNYHFLFNQGASVVINAGILYGALSVANNIPEALVAASIGWVAKKMMISSVERYQNIKADDAALASSTDYAVSQQFERSKSLAIGEIDFCLKQDNTFFNRMIYRVSGLFGRHQEPVSRAIKFGKALEERHKDKPLEVASGETKPLN